MSESQHYVGQIGVDAGMVWVGDPCYVMGQDASHTPATYEAFLDGIPKAYDTGAVNWCAPLGPGVGFAVPSGYGDGSYPVFVTVDDQTKRVMSVTVRFDEAPF